ncbi:hypothetical protein OAD66_02410 [Bacteroidia bacterium]|nr:hypothetical protein [Bacteroidia bacterium]
MKKSLITLSLILFTLFSFGQIGSVEEINDAMSQGVQRGLKVLIPEVDKKRATKSWEKLMKEYDAKTEKVNKKDDYRSINARIPSLSDRPLTAYALFQETPEGVYMNVFFDIGGSYLNSETNAKKVDAAKKILASFAKNTTLAAIEDQIKDENKKLEKLEREQKNLEKNKVGYEKDIKQAKETLEKRENDLIENASAQETQLKAIEEQRTAAEKVKSELKKY